MRSDTGSRALKQQSKLEIKMAALAGFNEVELILRRFRY